MACPQPTQLQRRMFQQFQKERTGSRKGCLFTDAEEFENRHDFAACHDGNSKVDMQSEFG